MRKTDHLIYNVVLGSMLLIILGLIMFITASELKFNSVHVALLGFFGTLGGAFLGAWLAGRYATNAAQLSINENKLWNYEDFRKLLITHKRDLDNIYNHSTLIAKGNLRADDLNLTTMNISNHVRLIRENIDLESVPVEFYQDVKIIRMAVQKLESLAYFKGKMLNGSELYDKDDVLSTIGIYKVRIDKLFKELKLI